MGVLSIYSFDEYRDYIRTRIEHSSGRGTITRLAEAIQCQRSHLSRVTSKQLHLTLDQGFRLGRFFHFTEDEENYFLKMIEHERTGDHQYKKKLLSDLQEMKKQQEDISKRLHQDSIDSLAHQELYYSSWHYSAIHIAVSIDRYGKIETLSRKLGLAENVVATTLQQLESFGLVTREKGKWKFNKGSLHLPKSSPMNSVQHSNWRSRAVLDSQNAKTSGVHYTIVQSISHQDFEKIKQLILNTIDQYGKIAAPSKEEELVTFTCDFFQV